MTKITKMIQNKLAIALAIGAFTGIITMVTMLSTTTAQTTDINSLPVDEYKSLYKSRIQNAFAIASNHATVKESVGAAHLAVSDFELQDSSDKMTLNSWATRTVSGDWRNGYLTTYKGGKTIEIVVDRNTNAATSVQVIPRTDVQETVTFTDNQKRILEILFNDQRVQAELQGLVDGKDYWVQMVRDYDIGSRERGHPIAVTNIYSPDGKKLLWADFDLVTNEVFAMKSNFRQGGS